MKKRAQGISINTIVITVIALLVLVVLATILVSRSGQFSQATQSCVDIGGRCKELTTQPNLGCENSADGFYQPTKSAICKDGSGRDAEIRFDQVCCIPGSLDYE